MGGFLLLFQAELAVQALRTGGVVESVAVPRAPWAIVKTRDNRASVLGDLDRLDHAAVQLEEGARGGKAGRPEGLGFAW